MNEQDRRRRPSGGRSMTERERRLREIRRKKGREQFATGLFAEWYC